MGLAILIFALCLSCDDISKDKAIDRPNIVLFYADDLGWMDLAVQGSDYYESPNIDRIAREGMRFTRGYANAANCAPSRASLMTGLYPPRHKIYTVGQPARGKSENRKLIPVANQTVLDTTISTLPRFLKGQGYATSIAGKWHLSDDASDYDFDANFGGYQSGSPRSYFSPYKNPRLADGPEGEHLPARLAKEVSEWIMDQKSPFFVYMPFYSVHTPIQARDDLEVHYANKTKGEHHDHPAYAAMIHAMDEAIGEVMSTLEEKGVLDETLIIFTSDNGGYGPATSQRPLRGSKGMFYEGGIRVPFFVRWPKVVEAQTTCHAPVIGMDIFPTICEILGKTDLSANQDGRSMLALLRGEDLAERNLHWHFPAYLQMYRKDRAFEDSHDPPWWRSTPLAVIQRGDWKLMEFFEDGDLELYHLGSDIGEQDDVSLTNPAVVHDLKSEMLRWREQVDADVPTELNPDFTQHKN